jgi:hypothetical protein
MKQIPKPPPTVALTAAVFTALKIICDSIGTNATARVWLEYDPDAPKQTPEWRAEVRPNGLLGIQRISVGGPEIGVTVTALANAVAEGMKTGEITILGRKAEN